jgi:cephalosporin-C deacetylase-like acetyl esterase
VDAGADYHNARTGEDLLISASKISFEGDNMKTARRERTGVVVWLALALILTLLSCRLAIVSEAAAGSGAAAEKTARYVKTYEYDHSIPLNAEVKTVRSQGGYTLYHILYDSTNGERVPASLYMPSRGTAPHPCIVVQHGYGGDKSFGELIAGTFASKGYAIMAIDIEYHGERKEPGKDVLATDVKDDVRALHQTVQDQMRAVDYLETRDEIDKNRIGYFGASLGSFLGAIFTGLDKRIKAEVLLVGGGGWEDMIRTSKVPPFGVILDFCGHKDGKIKAFADKMDVIDPLNFAGLISPRPLLMINCENDKYVPKKTGEALYAAAGDPKEIKWFTCAGDIAHVPPIDKTIALTKKWFDRYLVKQN